MVIYWTSKLTVDLWSSWSPNLIFLTLLLQEKNLRLKSCRKVCSVLEETTYLYHIWCKAICVLPSLYLNMWIKIYDSHNKIICIRIFPFKYETLAVTIISGFLVYYVKIFEHKEPINNVVVPLMSHKKREGEIVTPWTFVKCDLWWIQRHVLSWQLP